ncbi:MAG: DUF2167 domain-containing protein [Rhodospirillales bacterium]|nr:MAG: DUF2167 domain-containing protein [Rhodospirillales bacterium]
MFRHHCGALLAALVTALPGITTADQGPYPETREALDAEYAKLQWIDRPGIYDLPRSGSVISFEAGRSILIGADAERLLFLMNGREFPNTEAVLYDDEGGVYVTFEFIADGYVADEDWSDVDPVAFLKSIRGSTEASNAEREKYGIPPLEVRGWLREPTYDATAHTVSWAIEYDDGDGVTVNATALKLGRYGHQELTWIGSGDQYGHLAGLLDTALADHAFKAGNRYADFRDGDRVAPHGLAALVAVTLGVEPRTGFAAAFRTLVPLFLKLGWIVIAIALAGIAFGVRKVWPSGRAASGGGA